MYHVRHVTEASDFWLGVDEEKIGQLLSTKPSFFAVNPATSLPDVLAAALALFTLLLNTLCCNEALYTQYAHTKSQCKATSAVCLGALCAGLVR